jgi:hypothetical protein
MNGAAGTKQRIIERNRYQPRPKAHRKVRTISDRGATQTFKKVGDLIITERATHRVTREGFQS